MSEERAGLIRKGRYVEVTSLVYSIAEVAISLTAGFATGSSALISWGVDSIVEGNSAAFMVWRLYGEEKGISDREVRQRMKIALGALSAAITIAVVFILFKAISKFISQETAALSWWGIGILLIVPYVPWEAYESGRDAYRVDLEASNRETAAET